MSKPRYPFEPDYAVAPGETLQEVMATMGMSIAQFADATNIEPITIYGILIGRVQITPDTAVQLERATEVRADMWLSLEANYRRDLARAAERSAKADG